MIEKFREIFDGLRSAYGITTKTGEIRPRDGKHETKNSIIRNEPTLELYKAHLEGQEPALGIIPINEDNLCRWGCVDIDKYDLNHKEIIDKTKDFPTQLFRSKSGGGHLFIFTKEWVPASLMRLKLKMVAAHIGYSGAEIIPKQDKKRSEKSVGSYLNLPYFNGEFTTRYAFNANAEAMSLQEFIRMYDLRALTREQLEQFEIKAKEKKETNGDFEGIPPCLKTLLSLKVGTGQRNETMFHLGVYLKKRFEKNWKTKMLSYNSKYFDPPLDDDEIETIGESLAKEDYKYKCGQEPMHSHCDPMPCAMVKYGVGNDGIPGIAPSSIEKYASDPPIYIVSIDGDQVECEDEVLWNADKFGMACMNQTQKILDPVSKPVWRRMLKKLFVDIQEIPAPDSSKVSVQLKETFENYAKLSEAKKEREVKLGKVWTENGKTIFKWSDFFSYLTKSGWDTRRYPNVKAQKLFLDLYKGKEVYPKINKKSTRVLEIDAIDIMKDAPEVTEKVDSSWKTSQN